MKGKPIFAVKTKTKKKIAPKQKKGSFDVVKKVKCRIVKPKRKKINVLSSTPFEYGIPFKKKISFSEKIKKVNVKISGYVKNQARAVLIKLKMFTVFIQKNNYLNLKKRILRKKKFYKKVVVLNYIFYRKQILKYFYKQKRKFKKIYYILFPTVSGRRVATAAFLILLLILTTLNVHNANATTYTFSQTAWDTDPSANTAAHPTDQSGWSKYSAKDSSLAIVNAGAGLQLSATAGSVTQTNDGTTSTGFNLSGNTLSNTLVSGTGDNAKVELTSTTTINDVINSYSVGTTPQKVAFDSSTNSVWVANYDSNTVSKLNASTGALIGSYSTGTRPLGIAYDPSTQSVWTANYGSNNVTKFNASNGSVVGTYATGGVNPYGIVFDSSTNSVWVSNYNSTIITKFSAADGSVTGSYACNRYATNLTFDSTTNSIWLLNSGSNTVSKFNAADGSLIGSYGTGAQNNDIAFDPVNNTVWITNGAWADIYKLNVADGSQAATYPAGGYPRGVTFDSVTNSMWVVNSSNNLLKMNPANGAILGTYRIGSNPVGVAFDSSTNSIWTANASSNTVTKVRVAYEGYAGEIAVGTNPRAAAYDPLTGSVWVANYGSNNVSKINVLTSAVTGTYNVGTGPASVTYDPSTSSVWVANYGSHNVTKLNPSTGATIGTYAVGTNPQSIVFDSSTNSIWTGNYWGNNITKVNASTGATVSYAMGNHPYDLAYDSYNNVVWVLLYGGSLLKINPATGAIETTYTGYGYDRMDFDSVNNLLWLTQNTNASTIGRFNVTNFTGTANVSFGTWTSPLASEIDSLSNSLWVGLSYTNKIGKLNPATNTMIQTFPAGTTPGSPVFDPLSNSIWVPNYGSANVTKINVGSKTYNSPGTYTSGIIDLGSKVASFSTLSFTNTLPANTAMTLDIRAGDSATVDGTWTSWTTGIASGGSIAALGSHRYVQYKANMASSDGVFSPTLSDVTIGYNSYPASQTLISSAYDTASDKNLMGGISWNEDATLPTGTGVTLSLRTSPSSAGLAAADWYDFTNATSHCTKTDTLVVCPNTSIPVQLKSGGNDQWWQYKVTLTSDGALTPNVTGVQVKYVVNSPPELQNVTASQGADGKVSISYDVKDGDTFAEGNNTPGKVTPSFEYWNGTTWVTCTTLSAGATDNQDVTEEYSTHTLTWDPKVDFNNHYMTDAKIRVHVNDNELANGTAVLDSGTFTLDTTDPVVDSFILDARSDATNNISISVTEDTMSEFKMKLSNNSDLSTDSLNSDSGAWVDYAATKDWNFASDNPTVYYQFKDKYGNISNGGSTHAVSLPQRPVNVVYQDVSNSETNEWREFVAWGEIAEPTLLFQQYNIYRSTTGTNDSDFTLLDTRSERATNFILDADLNTETTYYYRVTAEDKAGNISAYSNVVSDRPDGQGGTDLTPPVISNVQVSQITAQSALVTWDTDEPSNSTVSYITNDSGDFTNAPNVGVNSMMDYTGRLGQHAVFLTNLSPGVKYYIQVSSADPNTNTATGGTGISFDVLSGPVISGVQAANVQNSSVTITWNTSSAGDSHVYYSTDPTFASNLSVDQNDNTTTHSVALTGLTSGRTYYYYVQTGVAEDKNIINGEATYYNFATSSDSAGPVIAYDSSTGITEKTETGARISWTTDELATSQIDYGADDGDSETPPVYDHTLTNENLNTNHTYALTELTRGTLYNFRLKNADSNGNPSLLTDLTFSTLDLSDTTPPEISNVAALQVLDTSATITWTTDEPANSFVNYGTVSGTYNTTANNATYDYSHSVVLSGLTIKTQYFLKVTSIDSNGNSTTSETEISFTTSDTLTAGGSGGGSITIPIQDLSAPIIGNVLVKNITANQVTIEWGTNKNADSAVEFGPTTSYGLASINRMPTMNHSQVLINLFPGTPYNYKITSIDTSGNLSAPYTGTFTTTALSEIPKIETTPANPEEQAKNDAKFADVLRNAFDFIKQASKTVSLSALESSLEEQQNNIRELSDLTPNPKIISGPEIKAWEDMVSISWTTDKKTNSLIAYSEEGTPLTDTEKTQVIGNPGIYSLDHQVIISGLKPDTTYNYQIRGATVIGSSVVFPPDTFTTLAKSAKVDNYVADRLSDDTASFKWSSSVPTNTSVRITPYRNNALSYDEARVLNDQNQTSIHQMTVDNLEPGVFYKIDLFGTDNSGRTLSQSIEAFSTSSKELPFMIEQVKTSSALAPGESLQVQSIISWNTTKLSTSKVYYRKGTSKDDNNWPLESNLDTGYTRHHLVVMTDFDPGEVYQFQVESSDSNGERVRSKTYTILTPRQKESVFQVIFKNVEQTFGWMGGNGN